MGKAKYIFHRRVSNDPELKEYLDNSKNFKKFSVSDPKAIHYEFIGKAPDEA